MGGREGRGERTQEDAEIGKMGRNLMVGFHR